MISDSLPQLLSAAVSPMLVISAAGLLLLSMTNRYGRVIDRARAYRKDWSKLSGDSMEARAIKEELEVVWKRARLLRLSISLATMSVLGVVATVLGLFFHLLLGWQIGPLVLGLFGCSLAALAASLLAFLRDMTMSLKALEHEIKEAGVITG
jgi:Protein of unknown function (DUF2721)